MRSHVRHRPIVFQLQGVEERLLQQRCDDSMALRNRQLTTEQWCIAHYGQIRQQHIDGRLQNWRRHLLIQGTRLWEDPIHPPKNFETLWRIVRQGPTPPALHSHQCLLKPNQLSVPKFAADDLEGAGALFKSVSVRSLKIATSTTLPDFKSPDRPCMPSKHFPSPEKIFVSAESIQCKLTYRQRL